MELTAAAKVTLTAPRGTSASSSSSSVGAAEATSAATPNSAAEPIMMRSLTLPRAPVASAPPTEPIAIATASAVYAGAPPSKVKRPSSGSRTWKLNARVPTTTIIASGISSDGSPST